MTISYNWLNDYLPGETNEVPGKISPGKLSEILTAIGLEVESMENTADIKGGLKGLLIGEVLTCEKHPGADKLKLTTVSVNNGRILQIVCGAENVAAGQKVVVAPVGTIIHPTHGNPVEIKKAKIRGVESEGMICAEDEIGIGNDHNGILILPESSIPGTAVSTIFKTGEDHIFEIGLTPNRIDAMSHLGVARDLCAYLSHHNGKAVLPVLPFPTEFKPDNHSQEFSVLIENTEACKRYSGIAINGITIAESPTWLKEKLSGIGLKPINNIVDITNFILHETGQPLHAFDSDKIKDKQIVVRTANEGEAFTTLDSKERKLFAQDLLVCDASGGMCIAGVYGGIHSGVTHETKNIFIESAWFNPAYIRKTSVRHNLRTDAAARFEKGTDISNTVTVLERAALLVKEIAGGVIANAIVDVYPEPLQKTRIGLSYDYLQKLSGKKYLPGSVTGILKSLGFDIVEGGADKIVVDAPFSKPDISLPADIVEEIMRIDGLDNIEIPATITIAPSVEKDARKYEQKEKLANYLVGLGFFEIFTNSITNSSFYPAAILETSVKMINSLSTELNIMRPQMLQGGLQVIAHNNNRKNFNLRFFEFGKTYQVRGENKYDETIHLSLYATGQSQEQHWKNKPVPADFYYLKGVVEKLLAVAGSTGVVFESAADQDLKHATAIKIKGKLIGYIGEVAEQALKQFDVKQPVFYADLLWKEVLLIGARGVTRFAEISKFPAVTRDLSLVVDQQVSYEAIRSTGLSLNIDALRSIELFDIFESDKLGTGKKAMAVSFNFLDETKTLTDMEIDSFMKKIIGSYEQKLQATIRK